MPVSSRHIQIAALILVAASMATLIWPDIEKAVVFSAIDDGLYYQVVAENVVKSGHLTYDGISTTNGFQPLFAAMMVPIYWLVDDPWLALKVVYCLIALLVVGSCWLFGGLSRSLEYSLAGFTLSWLILFANLRSFTLLFSLLETPLVLFVYLLYLTYAVRVGERRFTEVRTAFVCGVLIGLAFLARTDSALLAIGYAGILIVRVFRGDQPVGLSMRVAVAAASGSLLLAVPYLLANHLAFGHLMQVSGYGKVSLVTDWRLLFQPLASVYAYFIPRLSLILNVPEKYHFVLLLGILTFLGIACGVLLTKGNRSKTGSLFGLFGDFILFSAIHFLVIYVFATEQVLVAAWYHVSELLVVALVAGCLVPRVRFLDWVAVGFMACGLVAQGLLYPGFIERKTMTWAKLEVAEYIRDNLPDNARLAMYDSGITSYFARRDFVGLNGVIGDYALADLIKANRYEDVVRNYGVQYLVVDIDPSIHDALPGREVFRGSIMTQYVDFREGRKCFAVYKIEPEDLGRIWEMRYR
jgi:hypothetical protein